VSEDIQKNQMSIGNVEKKKKYMTIATKKLIKNPCKFNCGNNRHSKKCERCKQCCEGEPLTMLRDHYATIKKEVREQIQRQQSLI